jgi:multicomponent Na+:H+ antiporter subunit D
MMMNNLVILPLLIPLLTGIILILFRSQIGVQKMLSVISVLINITVTAFLVQQVSVEGIQTLSLGGWKAPYGIILVADMFAVLLVFTTTIIGLAALMFAFGSIGIQREKFYFYPFIQFLLTGVIGSFLTGDLFNLFVFFEVMLISSYALITLGGTKTQLRESIKYILVNIVSSILFVSGVAYLYAVTGTLNMADLSVRVSAIGQGGLLTVIAIFFLIVFGLKAGLFLYFWLPGSYSAPPTAIAAIFGGLLTKVGMYAIIRMFTLIFYHEIGVTHQLIAWLAAFTMIIGVIGAVSHSEVRKIIAYSVVYAVGFMAFGLSSFTLTAIEGTVFYLIHDMIVKALLFLLGGLMIMMTGTSHLKEMGGLIKRYPTAGWMFFITALALVGVPPFSGFIGKLMIIQGGIEAQSYWLVGISLLSSLLVLYAIMKVFIKGFWGEEKKILTQEQIPLKSLLIPCAILLTLSTVLGLGAEWVYQDYITQAGQTLMDPSKYIEAVLPTKE